jgi:uncharacterized protein YndB with AHSA1/START domain
MSTLKKRIRIAAPTSAVHQALTDPKALRVWLAEYAEVDLPTRYQFWGRYTPDGGEAHQRLRHVDDTSLRFDWQLDGLDTTVDIGLTAESGGAADTPGSTVVTLTQTGVVGWPEVLTDTSGRALMHTFWALALADLADYVEGREPIGRCDFASTDLRGEVLIDADRLAVYASLTEPEQYSRWFGVKIEAELQPGGRWAMGGFAANDAPAHIVDIQPGRSMSVDWNGMVESWELADSDGRTRLTYVQSGFDGDRPEYGGWMGGLAGLAELRRYHEIKDWRTMWVEARLDGLPDGLLTIN